MSNWKHIIQKWLYPPTCILCGDQGHDDKDLCESCESCLPFLRTACPRCALPTEGVGTQLCGRCQVSLPEFNSAFALFHYDEHARYLVQNLKFGRRYPAARLLGTLLSEAIISRENRPEAIIPMPLHPMRYRTRGFNQSLEIAKTVSQQIGLPYDTSACRRIRFTPPQVSLTAKERRSNLTDAFLCPRKLNYKSVVILDDVITTGSTVNELSRTLRQAGVEWIEIWSIARA